MCRRDDYPPYDTAIEHSAECIKRMYSQVGLACGLCGGWFKPTDDKAEIVRKHDEEVEGGLHFIVHAECYLEAQKEYVLA